MPLRQRRRRKSTGETVLPSVGPTLSLHHSWRDPSTVLPVADGTVLARPQMETQEIGDINNRFATPMCEIRRS